ncbi:DNA repair protein [Pisolithus thermaeus]|nr:DNA repair protein [Pisolithus sp. B1]KAI6163659.1 DNA repair protein [Pisolithus thermaeus]
MHATTSAQKQREYVEQLQAEINALQARLGEDEKAETIVSNHIKLLHRYNEAKDATQILVGRLASLKGTTVRQIYIDMDLLDDAN